MTLGAQEGIPAEDQPSVLEQTAIFPANPETTRQRTSQDTLHLWGEGAFTTSFYWTDLSREGWLDPLEGPLFSATLNLKGGQRDSAQVFATGRVTLLYGDLAALAWTLQGQSGVALPFVTAEVSRLFLALYTDWGDLSVGRMIVNWGRGRALSPTDLLASAFLEGTSVSRPGTDVVRWTIPLGTLSNIDMVYTLLPPVAEGYGAAHLKANMAGWEMGMLAGYDGGALPTLRQGHSVLGGNLLLGAASSGGGVASSVSSGKTLFLGADVQGDLLVGLVGEGMLRLPLTEGALSFDEISYSLMGGINYSLGDLTFNLEYQLSGGDEYPWSGFRAGQVGFAQLSYTFTESLQMAVLGLFEPGSPEFFVQASIRYALQRGVSLIGYAHYQVGTPGDGAVQENQVFTLGSQVSVRF
ncbi:MAG TPA: hypothetical protein PLW34_06460 [Termitinemataceae bacterium]|nr:hypothetical protein [Termitinemataceae bacterium]HOM23178.1 hypothetical protein [Termitinemataceae bacterium]HPQ00364.1 hypothetical protein [Termitinemataceae bacterium]